MRELGEFGCGVRKCSQHAKLKFVELCANFPRISEDNGQCNGTRVERVKPKTASTNVRQVSRQIQRPGFASLSRIIQCADNARHKSWCLIQEYAICTQEAGGGTRSLNFESSW